MVYTRRSSEPFLANSKDSNGLQSRCSTSALGVSIPIILLLALFWHHGRLIENTQLRNRLLAAMASASARTARKDDAKAHNAGEGEFMDQITTQGSSKAAGFSTSPGEHNGGSIANSMSRRKEAVGAAAAEAMESGGIDLRALQDDLNNLKDTVTKFISRTGNEAAKSAREMTTNIAGQVGSVASDIADKGANMATDATNQAKVFGTELENMARRNPLGAIAGAVIVGVLIGMMGRRS